MFYYITLQSSAKAINFMGFTLEKISLKVNKTNEIAIFAGYEQNKKPSQ